MAKKRNYEPGTIPQKTRFKGDLVEETDAVEDLLYLDEQMKKNPMKTPPNNLTSKRG